MKSPKGFCTMVLKLKVGWSTVANMAALRGEISLVQAANMFFYFCHQVENFNIEVHRDWLCCLLLPRYMFCLHTVQYCTSPYTWVQGDIINCSRRYGLKCYRLFQNLCEYSNTFPLVQDLLCSRCIKWGINRASFVLWRMQGAVRPLHKHTHSIHTVNTGKLRSWRESDFY